MKKEQKIWTKKIIRLFTISLLVYLSLRYVLHWVLPFVLAALLAVLLHPIELRLESCCKKINHWKRNICCIGVMLLFFLIILVAIAGIVCLLCCKGKQIAGQVENCFAWCTSQLLDSMTPEVSKQAYAVGKQALSVGVILFLTFVASVRFLYDYEKIYANLKTNRWGCRLIEIVETAKSATAVYLKAQVILFFMVSVICIIGLYVMDVQQFLLVGTLIGFCDALPFLGTGTVAIPWAVWDIIQKNYRNAAILIAIYILCSLLRNALEPRLIGHRLGVHPLLVMSSMYAGVCLYGVFGILLGPLSIFFIYQIYKSELFT